MNCTANRWFQVLSACSILQSCLSSSSGRALISFWWQPFCFYQTMQTSKQHSYIIHQHSTFEFGTFLGKHGAHGAHAWDIAVAADGAGLATLVAGGSNGVAPGSSWTPRVANRVALGVGDSLNMSQHVSTHLKHLTVSMCYTCCPISQLVIITSRTGKRPAKPHFNKRWAIFFGWFDLTRWYEAASFGNGSDRAV